MYQSLVIIWLNKDKSLVYITYFFFISTLSNLPTNCKNKLIFPLLSLCSLFIYLCIHSHLQIARTFREKAIPCDVIWMDIDYMEGFRSFTFNQACYPYMNLYIALSWLHKILTIWIGVNIVFLAIKPDGLLPVAEEVAFFYFLQFFLFKLKQE